MAVRGSARQSAPARGGPREHRGRVPASACWAAQVRDLLDELARVRHNKVQAGLRELAGAMSVVKLNNLACMEVNKIRPFFQAALDRFFRLRPVRGALGPTLTLSQP